MSFLNSILVSALRPRFKTIEQYINRPMETQTRVFENLIRLARSTEWGKKYHYDSIDRFSDFRNRVPISSYEEFAPWIQRTMKGEQNILWPTPINWFSKSSGTTNDRSKFIPVSRESLYECHYKGGKDLLAIYFANFPESKMFSGKGLAIGGTYSSSPYRKNSWYGDVSAVIMANLPLWAEFVRTPSLKIALMDEWEEKIEKIARKTINQNITNISGVPTWTYVLLERILELTGKNSILEVWPDFEVFFHGAVAFHPYKTLFSKILHPNTRFMETYNASEGFFAIQDRFSGEEDMLLMLDYGIFYEFIPIESAEEENPVTLTLDQVEKNKIYALVISTNGGLWRYKIGDTVKFTSLNPFRIKISGRTKHFINAFGEELMIENAETAISKACEITGASIVNFTAAPIYFSGNGKGGHEWLIEFSKAPDDLNDFSHLLDTFLKQVNSDYEAKRYKNMALQAPIVHSLPSGSFYKWMKKRGKLGGQNKVPRLSNTREYVEDILTYSGISNLVD